MSARPVTPASPAKNVKIKSPSPGTPLYGCEHLHKLFSHSQETTNTTFTHYKDALRCIFDKAPVVAHTTQASISLTPNFLCLQCPVTLTPEDAPSHGSKMKHRFYVDSRSGALYCQMCDDFVWDPTLDDLRIRKIGAGTFSMNRKRKHEEMFMDSTREDPRFIAANTNLASCRANGLRGIYNAGATCYQNVILQTFIHNPMLRNFYLSDGHASGSCETQYCLSCAMDDMFQEFYAAESTNGYTAASILSGFWFSENKAFDNLVTTKEQDAHEFFQFLAEELHERNGDGKKPETGCEHSCNCIIHQTFYGKLQSTTTCQHCLAQTNQVQSFLDLSVSLENLAQKKGKKASGKGQASLSLHDCLEEEYIKSDKCEYRCNSCNSMQQARRQTSIKRLPNVLSIQLKRFEYKQGRNERAAKIETPVNFPLQLNMLPYTSRARGGAEFKDNYELARSCTYDLMSVVEHKGEIDTGHYVTYSRVGDQWFQFNDYRVELANKSDVLSAKAYLLFYIVRSLA